MAKRKYTKKSDYWNRFDKKSQANNNLEEFFSVSSEGCEPELCGESFYVSEANTRVASHSSSPTARRKNHIYGGTKSARFHNIANGLLPYEHSSDGVDVRDSIELCQKAYCNVSVFRNAIDIMSEFANSNIHLEGGSKKARDFVEKWFQHVKMWNLKDQYFREYYRSGNIFLFKVEGKFKVDDFARLSQSFKSIQPGKIPIKYILLNPYDIVLKRSTTYKDGNYQKLLSEYEVERLKNPKNDYDKLVYESLPPEAKQKIQTGTWGAEGISIPLDPSLLRYSFYKKQDYEPFAVPFGYPVLDDINFKLELKKIDQAICRTIENVILLITMGAPPDKGGINPNNIKAMQALFQNESVGRALVADYTTKAEFVIPDVNKVIGPDKYKVINEDIKEGLQNIIIGDERYSNTQVKAKIFLERLKEARNAFINDFLMPEIKDLCKSMGFKNYPTARFEEIDIKDEVQFQRVVTRLMELGVLPPQEGIKAINTGMFPTKEELSSAQESFVEERQKGFYNPLVGGVPMIDDLDSEQENTITPNPTENVGRPPESTASDLSKYSQKGIQETIYEIEGFRKKSLSLARKALNKKRLSKEQKEAVLNLAESVIMAHDIDTWEDSIKSCLSEFDKISSLDVKSEILDLAASHDLESYAAAILYHSTKISH
tara:strand:- start:33484 stop:35457 length:1974 start_codon:yes stop_codon:yes gene_type:complete